MSLFEAKTHLSSVVADLVTGAESEVHILRHGKPVARLTPLRGADAARRIGIAKGRFRVPDDIDRSNPAVARPFGLGDPDAPSA